MDNSFCVFATITPHRDHLDDARNAIIDIVPQTLKEPGCQMFQLMEGDDGCLRLYEEWRDETALQEHYEQSYTKAVFASYESWLSKPVEVVRLRRIA